MALQVYQRGRVQRVPFFRKEQANLATRSLNSVFSVEVNLRHQRPGVRKRKEVIDALCGEKGASVQGGVGPFGLLVMASGDLHEHTAVFFRVFRLLHEYTVLMCTDLTRSSTKAGVYKPTHGGFASVDIEKDKSISLRTLIDHSIVESFGGGGRTCMTGRVYPEHVATGTSTHLYVFNNGSDAVDLSKLEAWELATASVNVEEGAAGLQVASGNTCQAYY